MEFKHNSSSYPDVARPTNIEIAGSTFAVQAKRQFVCDDELYTPTVSLSTVPDTVLTGMARLSA